MKKKVISIENNKLISSSDEQLIKTVKDCIRFDQVDEFVEQVKNIRDPKVRVAILKKAIFYAKFEHFSGKWAEMASAFVHSVLPQFETDIEKDYPLMTLFIQRKIKNGEGNENDNFKALMNLEMSHHVQVNDGTYKGYNLDTKGIEKLLFSRQNYSMLIELLIPQNRFIEAFFCSDQLVQIDRQLVEHPHKEDFAKVKERTGNDQAEKNLYEKRNIILQAARMVFSFQKYLAEESQLGKSKSKKQDKAWGKMYKDYSTRLILNDLIREKDTNQLIKNINEIRRDPNGVALLSLLDTYCKNKSSKTPELFTLYSLLNKNVDRTNMLLEPLFNSLFKKSGNLNQIAADKLIDYLGAQYEKIKNNAPLHLYRLKLINSALNAFISLAPEKKKKQMNHAIALTDKMATIAKLPKNQVLEQSIISRIKNKESITNIYTSLLNKKKETFLSKFYLEARHIPVEIRNAMIEDVVGLPTINQEPLLSHYLEKYSDIVQFIGEEKFLNLIESKSKMLYYPNKIAKILFKKMQGIKQENPFLPVRLTAAPLKSEDPHKLPINIQNLGNEKPADISARYYAMILKNLGYEKLVDKAFIRKTIESLINQNLTESTILDLTRKSCLFEAIDKRPSILTIINEGLADDLVQYIVKRTSNAIELHVRNYVLTKFKTNTTLPSYLFNKLEQGFPRDIEIERFLYELNRLEIKYNGLQKSHKSAIPEPVRTLSINEIKNSVQTSSLKEKQNQSEINSLINKMISEINYNDDELYVKHLSAKNLECDLFGTTHSDRLTEVQNNLDEIDLLTN